MLFLLFILNFCIRKFFCFLENFLIFCLYFKVYFFFNFVVFDKMFFGFICGIVIYFCFILEEYDNFVLLDNKREFFIIEWFLILR